MLTIKDLEHCNNIHKIPKSVHVNKGICFDYRLLEALDAPTDMDYTYDFDVYLPSYGINLQRDYVWESWQQNEFILSILLEKPLEPVILIHHSENGAMDRESTIYYVIDGKQRLMTIQKFLHNEFPIIVNGEKYYWKDFADSTKMYFRSRATGITANVYYSYGDAPITDEMKIILFNYYNFAGTPQAEEHKNKLQNLIK